MKRFLSLVLSALFVFQLGNASCDAGSQWDKRKVICADVNLNAVQPQVFTVPVPVSQQQPIINVTTPEPTPQSITIQQPEMKPNFNVKVDATTKADKLFSWLKIALTVALGYAALKTFWPVVKFFTGIPNPLDTVKGWGEGAVKWVKGIWNEGREENFGGNVSENVNSSESGWGAWLKKWQIWTEGSR